MKNRLSDLNDHLFAQMERLADESLTPEQIGHMLTRARIRPERYSRPALSVASAASGRRITG